jgi:type II restriction/modification system DNA methylase subunit YeeA
VKKIPFFIRGLSTSLTESLHHLNNKYAVKGMMRSFWLYSMRKNIALLHWNQLRRIKLRTGEDEAAEDELGDPQERQELTFRRDIALTVIKSLKVL